MPEWECLGADVTCGSLHCCSSNIVASICCWLLGDTYLKKKFLVPSLFLCNIDLTKLLSHFVVYPVLYMSIKNCSL